MSGGRGLPIVPREALASVSGKVARLRRRPTASRPDPALYWLRNGKDCMAVSQASCAAAASASPWTCQACRYAARVAAAWSARAATPWRNLASDCSASEPAAGAALHRSKENGRDCVTAVRSTHAASTRPRQARSSRGAHLEADLVAPFGVPQLETVAARPRQPVQARPVAE